MSYETILYEVVEGVATLTLNRSDTRNALTSVMYRELTHAFKAADRDPSVRAVVLTGSGRGFCSGQDLGELAPLIVQHHSIGDLLRSGLNVLILTMRQTEKPIVGAINGAAAGAGASLALATDLRVLSSEARFVFAAFVNIGIIPDGGSTWLLQQLVGTSKALEILLLADARQSLDATEAVRLNLAMQVIAPDLLADTARQLALRLAALPTLAIGRTKRAVYKASERTLSEALEYEAQVQDSMFQTQDFQEGIAAFLEKRTPHFIGR